MLMLWDALITVKGALRLLLRPLEIKSVETTCASIPQRYEVSSGRGPLKTKHSVV